ncbi:MAG: prohibitin family protein [Chloroflexi bacterium]|nr:prohibitin family protein [Chloroflexota bacterium]
MIGAILSLFAIGGLAIAGFGVFMMAQAISRNNPARAGALITAIGVVIAIVFFTMGAGVVEIQPNEVGVVFNVLNGNLADQPLGAGLHIIIPGIQEVTIYSVAQKEYTMSGAVNEGALKGDDAVEALTNDGQQVRLDVTVIYRINPAKANIVHKEWQNRFENGLIRPTVRSVIRESLGQFEVQEIYSEKRAELAVEIEQQVRAKIEPAGFEITNVLIRNIVFSQEYVNSIEQKQVAQQQALEAEFRVQEKEQEADQARALARGEADAAKIRAEGETEALRLINEQLSQNPLLLQWRYVENLSDNVEIILIPSNSPYLFDLQQLTAAAGGEIVTPETGTGN